MGLERFINAQKNYFNTALSEIKKGKKETHWMWYIFPQICGLGTSDMSIYYGIQNIDEVIEYLNNKYLYDNLVSICNELILLNTDNSIQIFGEIDSLKLFSSMTLFKYVSSNEFIKKLEMNGIDISEINVPNVTIFSKVLDKFYDGNEDEKTKNIISDMMIRKTY